MNEEEQPQAVLPDQSRFLFSLSVETAPKERKGGKYQVIHNEVKKKLDTLKKRQVLKINSLGMFGNSKREDMKLTRRYASALYQYAKQQKWGITIEQNNGAIIIRKV